MGVLSVISEGISKLFQPKASFLGIAKSKLPTAKKRDRNFLVTCSCSHVPVPKVIVFSAPPPEGVRKAVDLPKLRHGQSTHTAEKLLVWKTRNKAEQGILNTKPGQGAA